MGEIYIYCPTEKIEQDQKTYDILRHYVNKFNEKNTDNKLIIITEIDKIPTDKITSIRTDTGYDISTDGMDSDTIKNAIEHFTTKHPVQMLDPEEMEKQLKEQMNDFSERVRKQQESEAQLYHSLPVVDNTDYLKLREIDKQNKKKDLKNQQKQALKYTNRHYKK